jgi:nucleoside-diphosphate-sugar epimerase
MESPLSKRAVITGATGFIGWHLAEWLRDHGWQVRAAMRPESRGSIPPGIERLFVRFSATELASAFAGSDVVFNLAGRTSAPTRRGFDRVNVEVTREVATAARDAGVRLVQVSSQAAAGPASMSHPRTESDAPAPCSPYGGSKLAGERVVEHLDGLAWSIIRPVAVYGPRDRGFLPLFRLARAGVLPGFGDPASCFVLVHVMDLVPALERAAVLETALHQTFFVGHPALCRTDTIYDALAHAVGRRVRILPVPRPLLQLAALWGDLVSACGGTLVFDRSKLSEFSAGGFACTVEKAQRLLGVTPTTGLPEGFAATAAWYREHGWLRD